MPCCPAPDGGLAAADADTAIVIVSTISAPCVRAIGAEAAARGVPVLDCGVTGGPDAAASGDLVCMVGGDPAVIERVRPVFDAISSLAVTMGPFGTGLAAKLARNLITYGSWLAAYEGQQLAEAAGISLAQLAAGGQGQRRPHRGSLPPDVPVRRWRRSPTRTTGDWSGPCRPAPHLAHKDLAAALELADSLDVDLPLAAMTERRTDDIFGLGEVSR